MKVSFHFEFRIIINRETTHAEDDQTAPEKPQATLDGFYQRAEAEIERLTASRSLSTIDNYRTALRSLSAFAGDEGITVPIDAEVLKRYECWLRSRNVTPNTISCYMRSLRSLAVNIYGDNVKAHFRKVYTGREITEKRAVLPDEIIRLRSLALKKDSFFALVRDLFLFSFYALGMPLVDIAFLRKSQLADGQISYYRRKTGQPVVVPLEPCMQEIIDRYQRHGTEYVFPLLHPGDRHIQRTYLNCLNRYNRALKKLGKMAGISRCLTSYVARHSWASMAYNANVDLPVISKALGHANPQHTLVYIRQINDKRINQANHQLLSQFQEDD